MLPRKEKKSMKGRRAGRDCRNAMEEELSSRYMLFSVRDSLRLEFET